MRDELLSWRVFSKNPCPYERPCQRPDAASPAQSLFHEPRLFP
jgi:hypothetical protein